jgi:hypothetical protein
MSQDDEADLEEKDLQKGFIVEDDYFSVSEIVYSDLSQKGEDEIEDEQQRKKIMLLKSRENKRKNPEETGPLIIMITAKNEEQAQDYKAVCFIDNQFPISP